MSLTHTISISSQPGLNDGIVISSPSEFTLNFEDPLILNQDKSCQWFVSVADFTYYRTRTNISAAYGNDKYYYSVDGDEKIVVIPEGYWSLSTLNSFIIAAIAAEGDNLPGEISPITMGFNGPLNVVDLDVAPGYTVTFPMGQKLNKLLGIVEGAVVNGAYHSDFPPDFDGFTKTIYLLCSLIEGDQCRFNNTTDKILHVVRVTGAPGARVVDKPNVLLWQPMPRTVETRFRNIKFTLLDAQFKPYGMKTPIEATLVFERRQVA